jgi:RNA polymerase sigma-70 factor (ECF subfamily)
MPGGSQPDDDLIVRIRSGDRSACEELVRRTYETVYRFLVHLTADTELAADLTQDTFRTAWQKLGDFDGRASVASWLHRIAYNRFIDVCRKRRRDRSAQEFLQVEFGRDEGATWACATSRSDVSEYLSAAVKQLSEDQRAVVVLHYFEGLSLQSTATVLEQPVGTVKWRLNAALTRLRAVVDAESVQ